ncbi:B3 domain-containing protein REM16-like [Solanum stenotomum]|uniref:B3 domain-containing protein REM16-like n=1 Tax=Solanum stenotomum TaxID=172797 RepID=UPI0020D10718|nr:B3 domain-containing protein REM16-like [Solanum stenotomum]XP_049396794.1 B3 domain-containing protein REM16-like [Solanum stenotomum]
MERANEACDKCKKDCLLIHRKRVPSFCKTMTDKSCLQVLILPAKFARSVLHLADQVTHVEDSSGLRWRVTVCYYQGLLAIQQGWPKFASQHRLDVGDLLVFQYAPGQHFTVQIFDTNGCEKIIFCCDTGKGKKRATTNVEETTQVRDAQYDHEDGRLCLHQSRFEMPASKPLAEVLLPLCEAGIKATGMVSRPAEDIPLLGPKEKKSKKASQLDSGEEEANGNEKVIKSKPAGLGDTPSFPAINYSCLVSVNGRDFLELPESWRDLLKRPMRERWIIFLRGPDKRIWPTYYTSRLPPYYSSRPSVDVLTRGWKDVAAAYGMNAKDDCLFQLADQQNRIFDIRKI